jgi:hypothetical protein
MKVSGTIFTIMLVVMLFPLGCLSEERPSKNGSKTHGLDDYLPLTVRLLRGIMAAPLPEGKTHVANSDNRDIRRAKEEAVQWIFKTVRNDRLPADPNSLRRRIVLLQNAVGPNDVAVCQWERDAYLFTVAQTATVIVIQVVPAAEPTKSETARESRALLARSSALRVLNGQVDIEIREPTTSRVVKRTIMPELLGASFDRADIQEYAGGLHGKCAGPRGRRDSDYGFWWRRVGWWTDGTTVGLYTLKTEGGAWRAGYDSALDARWFEGQPSRLQD